MKYEDLESKPNVQDTVFVKHEKYDNILEKDDQEHDEDGSVLKTPKKKKRKNADQIAPIKQEEQIYGIDNQQEEVKPQHKRQILDSENQIHGSNHVAAFDHLNSVINLKNRKRKYGEAFYDDNNDDENYNFSLHNESEKLTKKKKKSKKEKHVIEMPNADEVAEEEFSIDTSQEIASQDKKRKKKKKRDVTEEAAKDFTLEKEFHTTDDFDCFTAKDRPLATSPYINSTPEELITEMHFSKEHLKKLSKKVKPLVPAELVTSTPVEQKTKKESTFSGDVSRSKFSVVTGADSHPDFKQTTLLESMDHFSLMHSPILKDKHSKKEKESSPSVQSGTAPVKAKKSKKEKRLSSSQPSTVRESTEKLDKHLIKNSLESPVESKVKNRKKESHLSIKEKDSVENEVKRTMKTCSNINNGDSVGIGGGSGSDTDDHHHYGNTNYNHIVTECGVSGKAQVSDRLDEHVADIKRQSSLTRKSFTSPMNATSSLVLGGNTSEDGGSEEDNVLKSIPKLNRTPSSERSSKHSQNQSSSQTSKSSDRACSPDSGLSLSATSAEKDSINVTSRDSKREADSIYSAVSPKDGKLVKEKGAILPKTPKRKKIADTEEGNSHLTIKHRIKKEKESPISQPSRYKTDSSSPLRDNGSLEAERMKLLAEVIKKLKDENDDDLSMKDESHKPLSSSVVKVKQQSKQEDTMSDSDLDTSKSKKKHKRKESDKFKVTKSDVEVDNTQLLEPISYFKPSAERLSSVSTVAAGKKEVNGNRNCLGEGSPVTMQVKISGKTPRRKSTTGTEGSSSKPVSKTPVKTKEKESPNKKKVISASQSDEGYSITEESAGAMAERLLDEFVKRKSL